MVVKNRKIIIVHISTTALQQQHTRKRESRCAVGNRYLIDVEPNIKIIYFVSVCNTNLLYELYILSTIETTIGF